jgi:hypothetical protein
MQLSHGQKLLNRCAIEKEKPIGCINDYAMQPGMILILSDNPSEISNVSISSWLAYFMKSTEELVGFQELVELTQAHIRFPCSYTFPSYQKVLSHLIWKQYSLC